MYKVLVAIYIVAIWCAANLIGQACKCLVRVGDLRLLRGCTALALVAGYAGWASAATYTLPSALPAGCSSSSSTAVTCANLSLSYNDVVVVSNANLTLTITNALNVGGNNINTSNPASGFSISAKTVSGTNYLNLTGNLTASNTLSLSSNTNNITGNVSAGNTTLIGGQVNGTLLTTGKLTTQYATQIRGNVTASELTSGGGSVYGGNLTATLGDITTGSSDTIAGNVTSDNGSVTLRSSGTTVGAGVTAKGKVTLGSGTTVTGDVLTEDEVVLESSSSRVIGNIVAKKDVTLSSGTSVTGNVTSRIADVELKSSDASVSSCVTVDQSQSIKLDWHARVGGVCCLSSRGVCGNSCVENNSGYASPGLCLAAAVLVADWRMDESTPYNGTAGEINNAVSGGAVGTAINGAGNTPGKICGASMFNGVNQYVSVPGLSNLLSDTASLSFWIKTTQAGNNTARSAPAVAGVDASGNNNDIFWGWLDASGRIGVMKGNGNGAKSTSAINNGQWRHVVLTRDATSGVTKVYVDGALQASATSGTGVVAQSFSSLGRLEETGGAHQYFNGSLDEVKVHSGVLTDAEVSTIYGNESVGKDANGIARTCPVMCLTDVFGSGALDAALWNVAGVNFTPQVVTAPTVASNRLRLTDNGTNRATFAQFRKWFPGVNNKVVVEFDYFAWAGSGTGGDGIAVVLSDASVSPTTGGYGGSLGYANRSGGDGFGGGWLGIGLDEFGNFSSTGEGKRGYPTGYVPPAGANVAAGFAANSVAVRGSGSGQNSGYVLLAKSGTLATPLKTGTNATDSTTRHRYRITVDHSNNLNAYVKVERDTTGSGASYTTVIPSFDVRATNSGQAPVPANMLLSFTGSTGGVTNNHEIANVRVCATSITEVGNASPAANFECMDDYLAQSSYNNRQLNPTTRNPIYTKLARTAFKLRVVPLSGDGAIKTDYIVAGGASKNVTVDIFDDSTGPAPICSAYDTSKLVATQTATLISGVMTTGAFTVNKAYTKLRCRVTDNSVPASPVQGCSSDQFSVRPGAVTLATTPAMAVGPSRSATPTVKAGGNFTLRASTSTAVSDQYSGSLLQNTAALTAQTTVQDSTQASGGVVGALSPASLVSNATAVNASYSEVGYLYLAAGTYRDTTYTAVDGTTDCVNGSTSVTLSGGKYGCVIGNTSAVSMGRFIPDRFSVTAAAAVPACNVFTYFSQAEGFATPFTLTALNTSGAITRNYADVFARLGGSAWAWSDTSSATGLRFSTSAALPAGSSLGVALVGGAEVVPSGTWVSGSVNLTNVKHQIGRPTALVGETAVTVTAKPVDLDGVTTVTATAVSSATTVFRFGRLRMINAYGSEHLPLSLPLQAQYYDAVLGSFKPNTEDSCTSLSLPAVTVLNGAAIPDGTANRYFYPVISGGNQLAPDHTVSAMGSTLVGGVGAISFTAPGRRGWLDTILATPDHLKYNWGNCMGQGGAVGLLDDLPCARTTFGIYKSPLIYRRENY